MMERITWENFQELFNYSHPLSITAYINTDDVGLQAVKRRAQIQNFERDIISQLTSHKVPKLLIQMVKNKLIELKSSANIWDVNQKALALFISPDFYRIYQLPISVTNFSHVSRRFHLKPLIKLITEPQEFYLLSLSRKSVELYRGDRYGLKKVKVPNLPQSIEEVTGSEMEGRHLQYHTSTSTPNGGTRAAIYHGQSMSWKDDKQRYLDRFLASVDDAVIKFIKDKSIPMIVSGVERDVTNYHDLSKYRWLIKETALLGNDKLVATSELHKQALAALDPYFLKREKAEMEEMLVRGSSDHFSTQIDEILRQAHLGKVDAVVVAQGVRQWGQFDPDKLSVTYTDQPTPTARDLLDTACAVTLLNGGRAYVLPPEDIPDGKAAVAVFRYS